MNSDHESIIAADQTYVWHPYTQAKLSGVPLFIERAEGIYLYGHDGKSYIDAVGSWWVNCHGHCHSKLIEALHHQAQQLEHVIFAGITHRPAVKLAEALINFAGAPFQKVFFSDNGSTAVEVAMKMAWQYFSNKVHQKNQIIAYRNAYHGDTFGAMSVSGRSIFTAAYEPLLFDVKFIDPPYPGQEEESNRQLMELLQNEDVAAFIFEPLLQGAGGMLTYSADALDQQIALCKEFNVLCIADEVFTGFYRTGEALAIHHLKYRPDIVCLSKALSGGMLPLGVTIATESIFEAFLSDDRNKTFFHGHSFTANPMSCAVALASLKLFDDFDYLKHIKELSYLQEQFAIQISDHQAVKSARHIGVVVAVEFHSLADSGYLNAYLGDAFNFFLERGVLIRPLGNVLYLVPPFIINSKELAQLHRTIVDYADYLLTRPYGKKQFESSENFD
ncbi:MAG: adenosylmethionine--8-amino-7-oxononanoate transaminase [Flavobacteriales bacterium]